MANFGSDLDGVIIDIQPVLNDILNRYGYHLEYEDIRSYEIEKLLDIPPNLIASIIEETVRCTTVSCYPEAIKSLEILNKTFSPIHLVTSRKSKFNDCTCEIIDKNLSHITHTFYNSTKETPKSLFCNALHLSYFVEDRLRYAKEITTFSPTIVFLLDRPWNRKSLEGYPRIIRVYSWNDILKELKLIDG